MHFLFHRSGHRPDHDPVDSAKIYFAGIIEERLECHMIMLRADIFLQCLQAPQLRFSGDGNTKPGIGKICIDLQKIRPL